MAAKKKTVKTPVVNEPQVVEVLTKTKNVDVLSDFAKTIGNVQLVLNDAAAKVQERLKTVEELDDVIATKTEHLESLEVLESEVLDLETVRAARKLEDEQHAEFRRQRQAKWDVEAEEYNRKIQKRNADDVYEWERNKRIREDALKAKEDLVKQAESELVELRKLAAGYEKALEDAQKKGDSIASKRLELEFAHQKALTESKFVSEKSVLEAQVANLNTVVTDLRARLDAAQNDLVNARQQLVEVATAQADSRNAKEAMNLVGNVATQNSGKRS